MAGPPRRFSDFELGWLVGFWEGEGSCFSGSTPRGWQIRVDFTQKDIEPLLRCRDLIGPGTVLSSANKAHRLCYYGSQARSLLQTLKPHVSTRRRTQIDKALQAWASRPLKAKGTNNSPGQLRLIG